MPLSTFRICPLISQLDFSHVHKIHTQPLKPGRAKKVRAGCRFNCFFKIIQHLCINFFRSIQGSLLQPNHIQGLINPWSRV